jgi:hypothetical protein
MDTESRISKSTSGLMIAVAVLFDVANGLINLVPIAGQILSDFVTIVAYGTFWLWFTILGISMIDPKKALRFFGTGGIEMIPVINALPALTLGVFLTISMVKLEDKGIALPTPAKALPHAPGKQ